MEMQGPAQLAPDAAQILALAASGRMALPQLLDAANQWVAAGQPLAAAELYALWEQHTASSPYRHVACFNRGTVLAAAGDDAAAEQAYRQALAHQPDFAQALLNLGHLLERRGESDQALALWQQVADGRCSPAPTQEVLLHAVNNIARLNESLRRYDEAEAWMRRSLALKSPQFDVIQHYVHIRQKQCAWPVYQPVAGVTPHQLLVGTSPLAMLSASDDPALQLLVAQRFVHERVKPYTGPPLHSLQPPRQGRLRIGYLSGDLCLHAVGLLTVELLELHDRSRFEVWGFCWSRDDGTPLRARILKALDHHVRLGGVDDAAAAQLIAQAGIDVLVDLQGLTNGARPNILGYRAAPAQVAYLGLPATSCLPGVDWVVADPYVMPDALQPYFSEKPLVVPRCYQVSDRQRVLGPAPTRESQGLPADAFVYCSFNNTFKFSEDMFGAWMRVLQQVPGSVLWLLADNEWARDNLLRTAQAAGIGAERLVFAGRVAPDQYLARFQLADLVLDTFPYNAGTTASDVLWAGTPILTRSGRSYISRMAGSLLQAVGLPELATDSLADYERMAVQLGRQPARIASYKRYLREQGRSSALFDVPGLVRDLEGRFEELALACRAG